MKDEQSKVKAVPILIGPANAEATTGFNWRWCRGTALTLGVPLIGAGRKRAIRADLFLAALEQSSAPAANDVPRAETPAFVPADPAAAVRALLGKKLKAGAR